MDVCRQRSRSSGPRNEVFDYLADGENMPRWMKAVPPRSRRSAKGPIGPGTEFRYHDKRGTDSTYSRGPSTSRPAGSPGTARR